MSLLIPPQFDEYGTTFWIPSQVEPSVALIGTSLPAIRQLVTGVWRKDWVYLSRSSIPSYGIRSNSMRKVDSSNVRLRSVETGESSHA